MSNEFEDNYDDAIDFRRIFSALLRWLWLLLLVTAIGVASAYFYSRQQTPVYEATTNVLVTRNSQQTIGDISQSLNITQLVETYVRMLTLNEFLGIVSERLGYTVATGNVKVSALTNTQVIQLHVQDTDPARAALIADTMVIVLGEQNESLQAGRYSEAERSLDIQIADLETRIADVQSKLDEAKTDALVKQIAEAQTNIDATVSAIKAVTLDLQRLRTMTWYGARFGLREKESLLVEQQAQFDRLNAQLANQQTKLTDPQVQADANLLSSIQTQITYLEVQIEKTHLSIEDTQKEIEFLKPLITEGDFNSVVVEKENFLKTQQSLLTSYQNVYTNLLSTEDIKRSTNEIDNLRQNLELYQNRYLDLLNSRENIKNQKLQNIPTIEQVSPAAASERPVKPRTSLNTLLGGVAGLILALSFVLLRDMTDDAIKGREDVESLLNTKVVGYVVDNKNEVDGEGIYVARAPRSPVAEAFRALRTNLEFSAKDKPIKSLIVTSGGPGEGKTTVASNLAAILSHSGKKVILMDADLRRPRVHKYTGIQNNVGLSDILAAEQKIEINDYLQTLENLPDLHLLPSGGLPANPSELLGSEKMKQLLADLSGSYDYIIIDAPPMLVSDPQVLLGLVDGVLLVLVPGKTPRDVVSAVKEQVSHTGVRLLGVVFNRLKQGKRSGYYGGYSGSYYNTYYSSSYYAQDDTEANGAVKKKGLFKKSKKRA